jgi:uncharacterized protein YbgA (DUF1722 family)
MEFILSPEKKITNWKAIEVGQYFLSYNQNNAIQERELVAEKGDCLLLGDVNIAFANLVKSEQHLPDVLAHIEKLTNGYLLLINKKDSTITLLTDIFGYYHLFALQRGKEMYVSSDFKYLLGLSGKKVDDFALLDLVLFNYTLLDRTLISDIKRLKGGTELVAGPEGFVMKVKNNFAENYTYSSEPKSLKPKELGDILVNNLSAGISQQHEIRLTVTGGFDSRALLAASNRLKLNFSSFTFGQAGNIEMETPKTFIGKYVKHHKNYLLDNNYLNKLPEIVDAFIDTNLDNPTMLDIVQYSYIKEQSEPSNIITGIMGGEVMAGQAICSQVTFNDFASKLITSRDINDLEMAFDAEIEKLNFLNRDHINSFKDEYLMSLTTYFQHPQNLNLLRFLLNEKYSKFFGTINKVFKNHSNLVIPFLSADYLRSLLDSDIGFLRKKPFYQNPVNNMKYKLFYAKMIKYMSPELGETRFDRLYKLNDLCHLYRLPIAAAGYIKSHLFGMNKSLFPKPHHYDLWFREIIIDAFSTKPDENNISILTGKTSFTTENYDQLTSVLKKRLANATSGMLALKKIRNFNSTL